MTESAPGGIDAKIVELVSAGQEVTLDAIGGVEAADESWVRSPLFHEVANAVVSEWGALSNSQHEQASGLFAAAITTTTSPPALIDTCKRIVPRASDLGIATSIKDALHGKAAARSDDSEAALAAIAIRWLAHLAVNAHAARPALHDVLLGVAAPSQQPETPEFAVAAAQAAGLAHDFWRDQIAWECLERLTDTDAEADAWFALGQARLVQALEADSTQAVMVGLVESLECFDNAKNTGEDRADAKLYAHIIRFVRELSNQATAEMLQEHAEAADSALREYMVGGRNLPEQPIWLRPTCTAENAWTLVVGRLHRAIELASDHPWYRPALVIGALSDAYVAANSLWLSRHDPAIAETPEALTDLLIPPLMAPFVERAENLALVEKWVHESDSPNAEAFARLVRQTAKDHLGREGEETADRQTAPPKKVPPGNTRR
ncbi:MAG: hypothetical protein OXN79_11660 [bacterium]|nr:hypothetical protein [bacterium]MDE0217217.1 hypothetical protein [bacterium]